jgi:L-rhamnose isomerase/sugar isomerase
LWDFPNGLNSTDDIKKLSERFGVQGGSINPNLFQDQEYKYGSFGNPDPAVRKRALDHTKDSIEIASRLQSRDISLWFADGSNYPGTANIRQRKQWFEESLRASHDELALGQRLLIEYKPFEPAFYHTDVADWGMALHFARFAGPQAKVLVDTGHHYAAQNIEQIVAWLLSEDMLGGFHFNDRRYADDDLTLGSIDPYQVFRIFHEILFFEWESGKQSDIAYTIDQSHNLKGKIEAMIQTVTMAQELFSKAVLVDYPELATAQKNAERRPTGDSRVARVQRSTKRSHGRLPPQRIPGADYTRALRQEFAKRFLVCIAGIVPSLTWPSTLGQRVGGPSSPTLILIS